MSAEMVDKIVRAVLYEGYILYPYRPSVKNSQRWTFGGIYPEGWGRVRDGFERCVMQTECLLEGGDDACIDVNVRFLQPIDRQAYQLDLPIAEWDNDRLPQMRPVASLRVAGTLYQSWQEATEREICISGWSPLASRIQEFSVPSRRDLEPLRDGDRGIVAALVRQQEELRGEIQLSAQKVADNTLRLCVRIVNRSPMHGQLASRDEAVLHSFASTHTILTARSGAFVSAIDPPERLKTVAEQCANVGAFPVLAGEAGSRNVMLSSPIILYDYPEIAPESPGDMFDGTEIDEILSLRVMTLTDAEKEAVASVDERARQMLDRTETLARGQLASLHGAVRGLRPTTQGERS